MVDTQNPSAQGGQIKGTGAADATTVDMVNQPSGDVEKSRPKMAGFVYAAEYATQLNSYQFNHIHILFGCRAS